VLTPGFDSYDVHVTRWPMKHILIASILLAIELSLDSASLVFLPLSSPPLGLSVERNRLVFGSK
jgi:hypothetical protein